MLSPFNRTALLKYKNCFSLILLLFLFTKGALHAHAQGNNLTPFEWNKKYGYLNETGQLAIDTIYSYADEFSEGLALVEREGKKFYIDPSGKVVIGPLTCQSASAFSEGWARIQGEQNERYYIDKTGAKVLDVPLDFYDAQLFHNGLAVVSVQEDVKIKGRTAMLVFKFGYMDKTGALVIPCQFFDAGDFADSVARVKMKNKYGLIDAHGKFLLPAVYDYIYPFSGGVARIDLGGLAGFINTKGKVLIKPKYTFASDYAEGLIAVRIKDKIGYINLKQKVIIKPEYDYAESFSEGYAAVMINKKWGFIDSKGAIFVPLTLDEAQGFSNGMAAIRKHGHWGFMNKKGKVVIQPEFDGVSPFSYGLSQVQYLNHVFYINKQGVPAPVKN